MNATSGAIQFVEHHADDAAASVVDELANESGFVHGVGRVVGFSARERTIPWLVRERGPCGPAVTFRNKAPRVLLEAAGTRLGPSWLVAFERWEPGL